MRHHYRKADIAQGVDDRAASAKRMFGLMSDLLEELNGMSRYVQLLMSVAERKFPEHTNARKAIAGVEASNRHYQKRVKALVRQYEQFIADHEHQFGPINAKPLMDMRVLSCSIEELMSVEDYRAVERDFFDE